MSTELDDFEYTLTRRALRQIKAEAWDEGFTSGFYSGQALPAGSDASESVARNPYDKEDQ